MRVKCLAQEHNAMTRPGLEPGPFDLESSALEFTRPPRLPQLLIKVHVNYGQSKVSTGQLSRLVFCLFVFFV